MQYPSPYPIYGDEVKNTKGEIDWTSFHFMAAAYELEKRCKTILYDYYKCKSQSNNPFHCKEFSTKVTECGHKVKNFINEKCPDDFREYSHCLESTGGSIGYCRRWERKYVECLSKYDILKETPQD